ncbi:MAG: DNA mismatch repair endonuclease MutL [Ruminococcaceae bacterium]|nr:DNA mismatch repair endonuclease MutL [Oscillospiraceae bacterium]
MGRVNVLDKHTAELIAAGEVVERPASVVKELVENSIDAGAGAVTVEIKSGGVRYIRITDDGEGIHPEDVPRAFLRHATSKISRGEDLDSIATLGFRGEALASIAAVARVELITATSSDQPGVHYVIEGGEEKENSECGCARGTTIVVRDLFYNTPARLKFLKTDVKEGVAVASLLDRLALSHPEVSFRLVREGKQTLVTPGDGKLSSAVYAVFGKEFFQGLIPVDYAYNGVKVSGFICKPTESRPNSVMQSFFINGRYCRSKTMQAALEAAYKGSIMVGRRPACVLYIELDCSAVDVNVHPAKLEVRFTNEKPIFDAVYGAVKSTLNASTDRRQIQMGAKQPDRSIFAPPQPAPPVQTTIPQTAEPPVETVREPQRPAVVQKPAAPVPAASPAVSADDLPVSRVQASRAELVMRDPGAGAAVIRPRHDAAPARVRPIGSIDITAEELPDLPPAAAKPAEQESVIPDSASDNNAPTAAEQPVIFDDPAAAATAEVSEQETAAPPAQPIPEPQPSPEEEIRYRLVGELFDTYILLESGDEMVVIDKHAAHERLIYEQLRRNMPGVSAQMLLEPVAVTLDRIHCQVLMDNAELLESAGFEIDEFGSGTVLVRSAPMMIGAGDIARAVEEIAGNLASGKKDALVTDRMDRALHTIACRAAIKGGDRSRPQELAALVAKLMANPDVRYCPHGRPIYTVLTRRELEKSFGRIQ